ncbi:unnamed protein product, partial [Brassica napus]
MPSHSQHEKPAPTTMSIMEWFPSTIINNEVTITSEVDLLNTTPTNCAFESPSRFTILGDVDEAGVEASSSFNFTRGRRESKPHIKYQNMEWKAIHGRGK